MLFSLTRYAVALSSHCRLWLAASLGGGGTGLRPASFGAVDDCMDLPFGCQPSAERRPQSNHFLNSNKGVKMGNVTNFLGTNGLIACGLGVVLVGGLLIKYFVME